MQRVTKAGLVEVIWINELDKEECRWKYEGKMRKELREVGNNEKRRTWQRNGRLLRKEPSVVRMA